MPNKTPKVKGSDTTMLNSSISAGTTSV